jgi:homoserine kinase
VLTPAVRTVTAESRQVLPAHVAHADAAAAAGRAALLVAVLTAPDADRVALLAATHDTLHQPYRLPGLTATNDVVRRLRAGGIAAVLSGSGPAVLALCTDDAQAEQALASAPAGWRARVAAVDVEGARVLR